MRNGTTAGQATSQQILSSGSTVATTSIFGQYKGQNVTGLGSIVEPSSIGVGTNCIMSPINGDPNLMTILGTGGVMSP